MSDTSSADRLREAGNDLEQAVKNALATLEQEGVPDRAADEFIRECVFNAWWDWDYEVQEDEKTQSEGFWVAVAERSGPPVC